MKLAIVRVKNTIIQSIDRALHSPFGFQSAVLTVLIWLLLSFQPTYLFVSQSPFGEEVQIIKGQKFTMSQEGFIDNYAQVHTAGFEEVETINEDGEVVVKMMPKKREEVVSYSVRAGDNVSKIAHKFGLKVSTILWSNSLTSKETLQVGQKLVIPPTDGIFYTVRENDTLGGIIKNHDIEIAKVLAYNKISQDQVIKVGQELFLPSAQKRFVAPTVYTNRPSTSIQPAYTKTGSVETVASLGIKIIRPTKGVLTQGYNRSHYAIDIANKLDTPIYAAADGVVKTSKDGWNYGYGNYEILDHGNGVETLYGHMHVREVSVGQVVKRGQLIGRMGNSGRVFGPTGIHLHFELRIRDRKVDPRNYF